MTRRLVAALACRANGTRLYGKPLQNLEPGVTILEQIVAAIRRFPIIDEIVLGISEEPENRHIIEIAKDLGVGYILGDPQDVLSRLIKCGRVGGATDVFRVTTECPFFDYSMLETAWQRHVDAESDVTVLDHVPEGLGFEIYRLATLERSHAEGQDGDRSEFCSNFARFNQHLFKVDILKPAPQNQRLDLRLTVDYPEDLVLCRRVYAALRDQAPLVALDTIVSWLDAHPETKELVALYVDPVPVWDGQAQRS